MRSLVGTIVWKELREIRRDPITIAVAALLPLLMLYLFGSACSSLRWPCSKHRSHQRRRPR